MKEGKGENRTENNDRMKWNREKKGRKTEINFLQLLASNGIISFQQIWNWNIQIDGHPNTTQPYMCSGCYTHNNWWKNMCIIKASVQIFTLFKNCPLLHNSIIFVLETFTQLCTTVFAGLHIIQFHIFTNYAICYNSTHPSMLLSQMTYI
jgi:hypothetical protein